MRLILVLGDQLSDDLSALRDADFSRDIVVMAEVMAEGTYVPHHPQKIALVLTAMRKFAATLQALPLPLRVLPDDRFICAPEVFAAWAASRKSLRMEWFYRDMRRRTG